ncbi:pyroglutamyl-peptidase I [Olsenella phocaeensis]|uniref:pyroglutamyl-peptidase I n=1 Tax=Olsenella phocaeensis TaxID=1852385 RepID=UPI003A91F3E6
MGKVLVTGFEPFGGEATNPSWEAVRSLPDTILGRELVRVVLPVEFGGAFARLREELEACDAELVLCVGQAGGRSKVMPEFVGINWRDARIPDNAGRQPLGERILEGAPDALFSTLPVAGMARAAADGGVPAAVSYTAGTYVCNELLFCLLDCLRGGRPGVRGGFVHLPYLPQQAVALGSDVPSMSLDVATRGLELMLGACLEA